MSVFLSEKERLENIKSAIERDLPELQAFHPHEGRWHVCAGGPSLRKEIPKIKKTKGSIVSVNGTHDYLLGKGIVPEFFVLTDPQEHCKRFVKHARDDITYLIAAHCDPKVFDALEGKDVKVWYPLDYDLPVPVQVGGGTTVGLRAINIGYTMGYRDIHLWGFDGCIKEHHHAYPQPENDKDETKEVIYDGKAYKVTEWMAAQAHNFEDMMRLVDFKLTVHTHGLIKHIGSNYAR